MIHQLPRAVSDRARRSRKPSSRPLERVGSGPVPVSGLRFSICRGRASLAQLPKIAKSLGDPVTQSAEPMHRHSVTAVQIEPKCRSAFVTLAFAVLNATASVVCPAGSLADPRVSTESDVLPPIGTATMDKDGTIILRLRSGGPGRAVGEALLRYPRSHAQYEAVLRHVGPLRVGEIRSLAPWPD